MVAPSLNLTVENMKPLSPSACITFCKTTPAVNREPDAYTESGGKDHAAEVTTRERRSTTYTSSSDTEIVTDGPPGKPFKWSSVLPGAVPWSMFHSAPEPSEATVELVTANCTSVEASSESTTALTRVRWYG